MGAGRSSAAWLRLAGIVIARARADCCLRCFQDDDEPLVWRIAVLVPDGHRDRLADRDRRGDDHTGCRPTPVDLTVTERVGEEISTVGNHRATIDDQASGARAVSSKYLTGTTSVSTNVVRGWG